MKFVHHILDISKLFSIRIILGVILIHILFFYLILKSFIIVS